MGTISDIHALRQIVQTLEKPLHTPRSGRVALGVKRVDRFLGGGLCRGAMHEFVPAGTPGFSSAIGFVAALCQRLDVSSRGESTRSHASAQSNDVVWLRQAYCDVEVGKLYPPGLNEIGLSPESLTLIRLKNAQSLLQAAMETAGCSALGAVVVEVFEDPAILDLTATRKLSLLAEKSGVAVFCLRRLPERGASAAFTRWQIAPALSRPLEAGAPGHTAFRLKLLRHRMGRDGLDWQLEWDRDRQCFSEAPVSGAVVSLSDHRPAASQPHAQWRKAR